MPACANLAPCSRLDRGQGTAPSALCPQDRVILGHLSGGPPVPGQLSSLRNHSCRRVGSHTHLAEQQDLQVKAPRACPLPPVTQAAGCPDGPSRLGLPFQKAVLPSSPRGPDGRSSHRTFQCSDTQRVGPGWNPLLQQAQDRCTWPVPPSPLHPSGVTGKLNRSTEPGSGEARLAQEEDLGKPCGGCCTGTSGGRVARVGPGQDHPSPQPPRPARPADPEQPREPLLFLLCHVPRLRG